MHLRKTVAVYAAVVAIAMLGMWTALIAGGEVDELDDAPLEMTYHLAAELATAVLLLVAAGGLLMVKPWAPSMFFLAAGMLLYTVVNSAGYYAERGNAAMVAMFAVLTVLTLTFVGLVLRRGFRPS
jgi:uncharacterized membrane protein